MKTLLLTGMLLAFAGVGMAATAEDEVKAAHQAYVDAALKGDAAALDKLFADGLQYSHSNTLLENKAQAIAARSYAYIRVPSDEGPFRSA